MANAITELTDVMPVRIRRASSMARALPKTAPAKPVARRIGLFDRLIAVSNLGDGQRGPERLFGDGGRVDAGTSTSTTGSTYGGSDAVAAADDGAAAGVESPR